jgi:hypothetical protein
MSTSYTIRVTDEIITQATARDSSHCMIAEAVKASIPGVARVSVDLQTIRFTKDGKRYTFLTPRRGQEVLIDFDQGRRPEAAFDLRIRQPQVTKSKKMRPEDAEKLTQLKSRAKLAARRGNAVPEKRGGKTPPIASLAGGALPPRVPVGRRRAFGLRALDR